ncbi:MAG TPA: AAA family ATPase [Bacteroidales bacterium]|nr:AAA family ATPase [Bacteroidales bacterium]
MNLIGIKLKNFRGYKDIYIHLQENLQMIVGMNDIGKSTILEALDIFLMIKMLQLKFQKMI